MLSLLAALVVVASASGATPQSTASPSTAPVWQGITAGEPTAAVEARLGPPLLAHFLPDGSIYDWYSGPNEHSYIIVADEGGYVAFVRAFPTRDGVPMTGLTDPSGVTLGDSETQVRTRRGPPQKVTENDEALFFQYNDGDAFMWVYDFDRGLVHGIALYDRDILERFASGALTNKTPQPGHIEDGSSIANAFVLHARSEDEGVRFEDYYALGRGGCARWTMKLQSLLAVRGRQYDRIDLVCNETKHQISVFFDITSFFGKY